jgi:hypothetical protein
MTSGLGSGPGPIRTGQGRGRQNWLDGSRRAIRGKGVCSGTVSRSTILDHVVHDWDRSRHLASASEPDEDCAARWHSAALFAHSAALIIVVPREKLQSRNSLATLWETKAISKDDTLFSVVWNNGRFRLSAPSGRRTQVGQRERELSGLWRAPCRVFQATLACISLWRATGVDSRHPGKAAVAQRCRIRMQRTPPAAVAPLRTPR